MSGEISQSVRNRYDFNIGRRMADWWHQYGYPADGIATFIGQDMREHRFLPAADGAWVSVCDGWEISSDRRQTWSDARPADLSSPPCSRCRCGCWEAPDGQ